MHPHDPYDNKAWAPSFRQIVDMGNFDASQVISPSGQSGQLGSLHYDDLLQPWLKGEYHPMLWDKAIVEKEAKERLTILPK
jgi:penicillin amidase